jgi:hypothetical protein
MSQDASQPITSPPPAERTWTIVTARENPVTQELEADPAALGVALGELQFASRRQEFPGGRIETLAVVVRWRSFVPIDRSQVAPPREQDGTTAQAAAEPVVTPVDIADETYVAPDPVPAP